MIRENTTKQLLLRADSNPVPGSVLVNLFLDGLEKRMSHKVTMLANATELFRAYSKELKKDCKSLSDCAIVQ